MQALSQAQVEQFRAEGYLVVEGILDPERDLAPLMAEYAHILDGLAEQLYAQGKLAARYRDLPFDARLIQVCRESGRTYSQYFDFSLPLKGITATTPINTTPTVFNVLTHPRLLDVAESVLGPELYSNPVQRIRMKLPASSRPAEAYDGTVQRVPWHQDNGVVLPEADVSTILTVWVPITPATVANGCLQVVPFSHRDGLVPHCPTDLGVAIPKPLIAEERARPLPMRPGSLLLLDQRTMHSSLDNSTVDQVRISFDLRYQPTGQPTGRPQFPGFVARSQARPETVLHDPADWAAMWAAARDALAVGGIPSFNRWSKDALACA
jgi:phytanoyl-CoA hydroxylase